MGSDKTLLPINSNSLLKNLENTALRATSLETLNRYVNNPDLAPENILPWLAFAVSADDWSDGWSEQIKRNVIKYSIEVHKKKGTIGALRSALEAFNYENITVEEWFDYGGDPYFFRVFFDVIEPGFDVNILPDVRKVISNTKNARSHLENLKAFLSAKAATVNLGSIMVSKEMTALSPIIYDHDDILINESYSPKIATFFISKELTSIYPIIYHDDDYLINESSLVGMVTFFSKEVTTINPAIYNFDDELSNTSAAMLATCFTSKEITTITPLSALSALSTLLNR